MVTGLYVLLITGWVRSLSSQNTEHNVKKLCRSPGIYARKISVDESTVARPQKPIQVHFRCAYGSHCQMSPVQSCHYHQYQGQKKVTMVAVSNTNVQPDTRTSLTNKNMTSVHFNCFSFTSTKSRKCKTKFTSNKNNKMKILSFTRTVLYWELTSNPS